MKGELKSSGQGFFGDLAFRARLFLNPGRVIEALNDVEATDEALEQYRLGTLTVDGRDVSRELLIDAHVAAGAAREKLRALVFGEPCKPEGFASSVEPDDTGHMPALVDVRLDA